jgi:hypothetical protein
VLAYLSRYTHRVAISDSRLLRFDQDGVTFRYKNYREAGAGRRQIMTLAADELHAFHLAGYGRRPNIRPSRLESKITDIRRTFEWIT